MWAFSPWGADLPPEKLFIKLFVKTRPSWIAGMPKRKLKPTLAEPGFAMRRKSVPYEFVLDAISELSPETRPMFGCLAIYVGDKIVGVLRDKDSSGVEDNGMWLATTKEHHQSLQADFPNMRSIGVLGKGVTGWQILPADAPDFEEAALR